MPSGTKTRHVSMAEKHSQPQMTEKLLVQGAKAWLEALAKALGRMGQMREAIDYPSMACARTCNVPTKGLLGVRVCSQPRSNHTSDHISQDIGSRTGRRKRGGQSSSPWRGRWEWFVCRKEEGW